MKLPEGTLLPVHKYQEVLETAPGAAVLAEFGDGTPAIVAGQYGKGRTLYAGTMLCRGFDQDPRTAVRQLLAGLAEAAGVRPPVRLEGVPEKSEVEARVLECEDGRRLAFLLNHGGEALQLAASFRGREAVDLFTSSPVPVDMTGGAAKVDLELGSHEVKILLVEV
jgi:hypothetical protein